MRLFNRTTRKLTPTEVGRAYYETAKRVLEAIEESEAAVASFSRKSRNWKFASSSFRYRSSSRACTPIYWTWASRCRVRSMAA